LSAQSHLLRSIHLLRLWTGEHHPDLPILLLHASKVFLASIGHSPSIEQQQQLIPEASDLVEQAANILQRLEGLPPVFLLEAYGELSRQFYLLGEPKKSFHYLRLKRHILCSISSVTKDSQLKEVDKQLAVVTPYAVMDARQKKGQPVRTNLQTRQREIVAERKLQRNGSYSCRLAKPSGGQPLVNKTNAECSQLNGEVDLGEAKPCLVGV